MKHNGNIDLQNNFVQQLRFDIETSFPTDTARVVGRIIFINKRLYICVEVASGLPVWVPLTNEINTYVHTQSSSSILWTVTHNLATTSPFVQVYDGTKLIIPDEITIVNGNVVTVTLSNAASGRAVVMFGDITGLQKPAVAYEHYQTNPSNEWVVPHALGYYPLVRVFIGTSEVQPSSIIHDSTMQLTVNFSELYTGVVRCV